MAAPSFIDLDHHLSPETLARKVNPLKDVIRIAQSNPQLISLASGDPHYSLHPIRRVDYEVAAVTSDDPVSTWRSSGGTAPTLVLSTAQDEESNSLLRASMQYGHGAGLSATLKVVDEINKAYHSAPHHVPTMTLGNADAIAKCLRMLGSPGDHFLADEFTFAPMTLAGAAHGVRWVPVSIDAGGIVPAELERILKHWKPERGRRPHVLYTTPCGQNPTGSTLSLERRKQIYSIAQRYDVMILEDDPYFFLQYESPNKEDTDTKKAFPVSFLSLDVDGRVVRIDSFSKIMAPGMRLGWITSAPAFHAHLVKLTDLSTQHPAGFGQVLVTQLLGPHRGGGGWQLAGFDRWVRSLGAEYARRRDRFLALFGDAVGAGLAGAEAPESGMFVWIRVHVERHPRFRRRAGRVEEDKGPRTNTAELMAELFDACLAGGLVVCPSTAFILPADPRYDDVRSPVLDRSNFLRATFAGAEAAMEAGLPILGRVLQEFFAAGADKTAGERGEVPQS